MKIIFHEAFLESYDYTPDYSRTPPTHRFLRRLVQYINEYFNVDKAFLKAGGLKTQYGICWMRYQIQKYYNTCSKLPSPADLPFLKAHFEARGYEQYGYSSWERFIAHNLLKPSEKDRLKFMFLDW